MNNPLNALRHHVSGAIERGEAVAVTEQRAGYDFPKTLHAAANYNNAQLMDPEGKEVAALRYRTGYNCVAMAERIAATYNDPAGTFLQHCESQCLQAFQRGDTKDVEFWQRLKGNVRKAQTLAR